MKMSKLSMLMLTVVCTFVAVLSESTVQFAKESVSELSGTVEFSEQDDSIQFNWASTINDAGASVLFSAAAAETVSNSRLGSLNGFTGISMSINSLDSPQQHAQKSNGDQMSMNIVLHRPNSKNVEIELSPDGKVTKAQEGQLHRIVNGRLGEYFNQLSVKLGDLDHLGYKERPASSIHHFARLFNSIASKSDSNTNQWRWEPLNAAVNAVNKKLTKKVEHVGQRTALNGTRKPDEGSARKLLQLSGCSATPYNWMGDGYCDSRFNNKECNWDNGDCCEQTCADGVNWEDNNGASFSGYACGTNGYKCLNDYSECSVANKYWLGDGYCDGGAYNTAECGYDLGDCCEDTCKDGEYSCGVNGYNCGDSSDNYCSRSKCGNSCLGLCGADCSCWKWTCGDCHCHGECAEHDTYCSCDSMFAFWCVNVFWVNCNDGSLAPL